MNENKIKTSFIGQLASDMVMCSLPKGAPVLDFYIRAESPTGRSFTIQASIYGERAKNYLCFQRGDMVRIEGYISEPRMIERGGVQAPTYNISVLDMHKEIP